MAPQSRDAQWSQVLGNTAVHYTRTFIPGKVLLGFPLGVVSNNTSTNPLGLAG